MISRRTDAQHHDRANVRGVGFGCAQLRHPGIEFGLQAISPKVSHGLKADASNSLVTHIEREFGALTLLPQPLRMLCNQFGKLALALSNGGIF